MAVGVQLKVAVTLAAGVAGVKVPRNAAPAKNSTLETVAVPEALAVAWSGTATPIVKPAPAVGGVSATAGAAVTVTLIVAEVTVVPFESVTFAVRAVIPEAVGVQLT